MLFVQKGVKESPDDFQRLPKSSAIKIIDFGSTTFEYQNHTSVVSTLHYRLDNDYIIELLKLFWVSLERLFSVLASCIERTNDNSI